MRRLSQVFDNPEQWTPLWRWDTAAAVLRPVEATSGKRNNNVTKEVEEGKRITTQTSVTASRISASGTTKGSKRRALWNDGAEEESAAKVPLALAAAPPPVKRGRPQEVASPPARDDSPQPQHGSPLLASQVLHTHDAGLERRLQQRVDELTAELAASHEETASIMRKADRRFQEEKLVRRSMNREKQAWVAERAEHVAAREAAERRLAKLQSRVQQLAADALVDEAPGRDGLAEEKGLGPFCVACQSHCADTALLPCGHVCLCSNHAAEMRANQQLSVCPVCKSAVADLLLLQGM